MQEIELFHNCALFAYFLALEKGKQDDQKYVKRIAYFFYEKELAKGNKKTTIFLTSGKRFCEKFPLPL